MTKEEFVASEKNLISIINWLENTPLNQQPDLRKNNYAYLVAWLTNSPTVSIEINSEIITFTEKNSDLLIIFMGGWAKYTLENNYSTDVVKGTLAGIRSAIKVYNKNIGIKKDKEMDKLIALDTKGELEKWISDHPVKK